MKDRRVQSETFLESSSRAMMRMGHDEVHLLVWGRHRRRAQLLARSQAVSCHPCLIPVPMSVSPTSSWCAAASSICLGRGADEFSCHQVADAFQPLVQVRRSSADSQPLSLLLFVPESRSSATRQELRSSHGGEFFFLRSYFKQVC